MTAVDQPDLSRLLGIGRPGSWALLALFTATYLTLAVLSGGAPMATLEGKAALGLLIAVAALLLWPGPDPLPVWRTVVAVLAVGFITAAIVWHLDPVGWPGWSGWNFGGCTFLMFALALRGRPLSGLAGLLLMTGITVLWSWSTSDDPVHGLLLTYQQVVTYGAGAFIGIVVRRTARQIAEVQAAERERAAVEVGAVEGARQLAAELEHVRATAVPLLTRIASGELGPGVRLEARLLEAELRDHIRGRRLATPAMAEAARDARRRGVEITLLDDLEPDAGPDRERLGMLVASAIRRIADERGPALTIRLSGSAEAPVLTIADEVRVESMA